MLYVISVNESTADVVDTKDGITETATLEELYDLRKRGILIAGMTDDSIDVCSGDWLEDEFFQCCIMNVDKEFNKTRFQNSSEIFKFLVSKFFREYGSVKDRELTPVVDKHIYSFVADCVSEVCRAHGVDCKTYHEKDITSVSLGKRIYTNLGIKVYENNYKSFSIVYSMMEV